MIEMELNKIVIDEKRHDQLIVLKEKNGNGFYLLLSVLPRPRQ